MLVRTFIVSSNDSQQLEVEIFSSITNSPSFLKSSFSLDRFIYKFRTKRQTLSPFLKQGPSSQYLLQYSFILSIINSSSFYNISYNIYIWLALTAARGTITSSPCRRSALYPKLAKNSITFVVSVGVILYISQVVGSNIT